MSQEEELVESGEIERERVLPLLPLRGLLVFPYMVIHLDVGRERSVKAIDEAMLQDRVIFLVTQKEAQTDEPGDNEVYQVGTIAEIKQLLKLPGGTFRVLVEGLGRGRIKGFLSHDPFVQVSVEDLADSCEKTSEVEALMRCVIAQFEEYVKIGKKVSPEAAMAIYSIDDPCRLADLIAAHLNLRVVDKQELLESFEIQGRLQKLSEFLSREMEVIELERRISTQVKKQMEKNQKEYYLREQIKAIEKELGDRDEGTAEIDELRQQIKKAQFPKDVHEKALKELDRLAKMPPMAAESVVVRNYLDWLLALPWKKETRDRLDLDQAEKILEEDHYGLDKPKERILEYLAIRKLATKMHGPIICLVGPPGVGKTSLAKSIARALGRKFVRISLGGIRDEAEIRGHRRTYVGALPGRIIQGMKQAGTKNPVFLLDEVDKMNADFRGDPSSALLEVLDSEQNHAFSDHFIEVPFDLSKVLFLTTANVEYNIPRPLLDRMEVIRIPGYTEEEKVKIAERHLIPKQLQEHGLKPKHLQFSENAVRTVIRDYTREAGVRNLEREIASICRKTARYVVRDKRHEARVSAASVGGYLGIPRFHYGELDRENGIGVTTGLAWTEVGGETLSIEVSVLKGKGNIILTGKLGDVMKESAQAAFSYVRSRSADLGLQDDFHEQIDIHVHIPEGAIPKDGPSAGITMATAMASALTGRRTVGQLAMTGEITLRGRVLPVGGVKDKVLAAHRAGISEVILPAENKKDLEEIPNNVRKRLKFFLVENMDQVLQEALLPPEESGIKKKSQA